MPTTRKRISRTKGSVAATDLTEWDVEFLIHGFNILGGHAHSFKTDHEQRQAYRKNKKYLLSLMGQADDFGFVLLHFGRRFWSWYKFEPADDLENHYWNFCQEWSKGNRSSEFEWLSENDHLLPKEKENFERQELRHAEQRASLRESLKEKKIIDFPAKTNIKQK